MTTIQALSMAFLSCSLLAGCDSETRVGADSPENPGATVEKGGETREEVQSGAGTVDPLGGEDPDGSGGTPGPKRVFVTSTDYSGNLREAGNGVDGPEGADNLCNLAARAADLGGVFRAWLSGAGESNLAFHAFERIVGEGPWLQIAKDGSSVETFRNHASLATTPLERIQLTERGDSVTGAVWTGTENGGRMADSSCRGFASGSSGYNGMSGTAGSNADWTASTTRNCSERARLYCFEQ